MLYPFIYTRTKFHDYRVVTSRSLSRVPHKIVHLATEIARTLIDVENNQLISPTWTLVKKDGFILWGMAIVNKELGNRSQDKYNRPVRGFFGFITDSRITKLPYGVSYFKELYEKYVLPIWDSYEQTEQITAEMPTAFGFDIIEQSSDFSNKINVDDCICRIFPSTVESKSLIEAVLASTEDCSIATNVHRKKQCVDFGKDKTSFTNAIMSSDANVTKTEDVKVTIRHKEAGIILPLDFDDYTSDAKEGSICSKCGKHIYDFENICLECKSKQQNRKYLKYGLYGFMTLICLILVVKGPIIWKKILDPKGTQEHELVDDESHRHRIEEVECFSSFLKIRKSQIIVEDASSEDVFKIEYESSSNVIKVVSSVNWIRVLTTSKQFSKNGIIEFVCEPLAHGKRDGVISISNKDGKKEIIQVHQIVSAAGGSINEAATGNSGLNTSSARDTITLAEASERTSNLDNKDVIESTTLTEITIH